MNRTLFNAPIAQLQFVAQSVTRRGSYIDKYDALSISAVDLDDIPSSSSSARSADTAQPPKMIGLKRLANEISAILNEAYIEQQAAISAYQLELTGCDELTRTVVHALRPYQSLDVADTAAAASIEDSRHGQSLPPFAGTNSLVAVSLSPTEVDSDSQQQQATAVAALQQKQLSVRLERIYCSIQSMVDRKVSMLNTVQGVADVYLRSIVDMAQQSKVLHAQKKAQRVVLPLLLPLTSNRFFRTHEEERLLAAVRTNWAALQLHNAAHSNLAERQLSLKYFERYVPQLNWAQQVKVGAITILLLWALSECFNNETAGREVWRDLTFSIFVCFGDLFLLLVMWGVSMKVWRQSGIDFMRLLELEATELAQLKGHKTPEDTVFTAATNACIVFLIGFIVFNKVIRGAYFGENTEGSSVNKNNIVAHAIPAVFVLYAAYRLALPLQRRKVWWSMLWQVLAAPMYPVNFRAGYIGDLLTSLVRVLIPLAFSLLYVVVSLYAWLSNSVSLITHRKDEWWTESTYYTHLVVPFWTLLPLWLRFVQCLRRSVESGKRWPHIPNALKYTSAIVVIAFGTFQPALRSNWVWIGSFVFATCYQYTWDITQDWGFIGIQLPQRDAVREEESSGLFIVDCIVGSSINFRPTRLIGPMWIYLLVMIFNFVLRFAWTLTLLPAPVDDDSGSTLYVSLMTHLGPLLAAAEIVRRMVWGFFRLEWEQIERQQKAAADAQAAATAASAEEGAEEEAEEGKQATASVETGDFAMTSTAKFEKMGISSGLHTVHSSAASTVISSQVEASLVEYDWTPWMPRYLREAINNCPGLRSLPDFNSRLRCFEAVAFATAVVYAISRAALPTYFTAAATIDSSST